MKAFEILFSNYQTSSSSKNTPTQQTILLTLSSEEREYVKLCI
jgi:hypothetical protein